MAKKAVARLFELLAEASIMEGEKHGRKRGNVSSISDHTDVHCRMQIQGAKDFNTLHHECPVSHDATDHPRV